MYQILESRSQQSNITSLKKKETNQIDQKNQATNNERKLLQSNNATENMQTKQQQKYWGQGNK